MWLLAQWAGTRPPRDLAYHLLLASLADFVVHRYEASVVFVPMERQDLSHSHAVISHMVSADRARVLNGCYDPRVILGLMEHFDFAVGMRLHFLIFAALSGVPFLPLPYAGKVYDFAQAAGVPALHGVSREYIGPLLARLDELWDRRADQAARTSARIEACKPRAARTVERALALLTNPPIAVA